MAFLGHVGGAGIEGLLPGSIPGGGRARCCRGHRAVGKPQHQPHSSQRCLCMESGGDAFGWEGAWGHPEIAGTPSNWVVLVFFGRGDTAGCSSTSGASPGVGSRGKGGNCMRVRCQNAMGWQHPERSSTPGKHHPPPFQHTSQWDTGDTPGKAWDGQHRGSVAPAMTEESRARMASPGASPPHCWGHLGLNEESLNKAAFRSHTML